MYPLSVGVIEIKKITTGISRQMCLAGKACT